MSTNRLLLRLTSIGVASALIVAACSNDDSSSDTTDTSAAATTTAAAEETTTSSAGLDGEGLNVGVLAPSPGLLATLFQAQTRGIGFAADDIAAGGGVLGGTLNTNQIDTPLGSTEFSTASDAVDAGARVLIGPAGSTSALELLPELQRLNTVSCTASATLPGLTYGQEQPALFRTAVPDDVMVAYLAQKIVERRDEAGAGIAWKVAIVARSDDYGLSVGNGLAAVLEAAGLAPSVVGYSPRRVTFEETAGQVAAIAPDLTILISFEEGANLLMSLLSAGLDPATMIGLDGFFAPRIGTKAGGSDPTSVDGFTVLGTTGNRAFLERLGADDPNGQVAYAAQAYDCAVVLALAAEQVESARSATLVAAIQDVTGGGIKCTTYDDCTAKLAANEDIDYDGPSGLLAIDEHGDPTSVRFTTGRMQGGQLVEITSTDIDMADLDRQQAAFAAAAFITKLQQALRFLGFYNGPINGLGSPELTAAIAAFQASVGLPATGIFDAATEAALRSALGDYSDLFSASTLGIQQLLTDLGFYTGPLDGIWSAEVTTAVKALQTELGVPTTGVIDAATIRAAYERGLIEGSATTTTTTVPETTVAPTTPPATQPPATTPPVTTPPVTSPPETAPPDTVPETLPPEEITGDNLFQTLQADPDFSIFVELLTAAGFTQDTQLIGPYTVFAPTNAAFDAIDPAKLDAIKNDPETLRQLLAYHVIEGRLTSTDLVGQLFTINGAPVQAEGSGATLTIGGAPVTKPDVTASNGVIHGISSVLRPGIVPV
jgi:branched-chain amino acid transport system substrate-binding protein